jgi:hypothetical protein
MSARKSYLREVYRDVDGTRYYLDGNNDVVRRDGSLVSLTEEENVRLLIREPVFDLDAITEEVNELLGGAQ